jgi:hypothetical protein
MKILFFLLILLLLLLSSFLLTSFSFSHHLLLPFFIIVFLLPSFPKRSNYLSFSTVLFLFSSFTLSPLYSSPFSLHVNFPFVLLLHYYSSF